MENGAEIVGVVKAACVCGCRYAAAVLEHSLGHVDAQLFDIGAQVHVHALAEYMADVRFGVVTCGRDLRHRQRGVRKVIIKIRHDVFKRRLGGGFGALLCQRSIRSEQIGQHKGDDIKHGLFILGWGGGADRLLSEGDQLLRTHAPFSGQSFDSLVRFLRILAIHAHR